MRIPPSLRMNAIVLSALLFLATAWSNAAVAADWFVAPQGAVNPAAAADGSAAAPFASVSAAFSSGKVAGGDRILLQDGLHGALVVQGVTFPTPVTIAAENKHGARVESVRVRQGVNNVIISGLSVIPTDPVNASGYLVDVEYSTTGIGLERLKILNGSDADDFMTWSAATWDARSGSSGIRINGSQSYARWNRIVGVYMGITVAGDDVRVAGNYINGYNGDGLRGLGNNNHFRRNRVFNCVDTDGNHDDGFQSFTRNGSVVRGLTLDQNVIIEWTGEPTHPLRCKLQGIGLFDGFFDDLTVTNNLVATTQYHGITVVGTRRAKIINNTVVNANGPGTAPWIMVSDHKNGQLSTDVIVANNLTMHMKIISARGQNIQVFSNSVVSNPVTVFEQPFAFDYRPKVGSGLLDTADSAVAPARDLLDQKRTTIGGQPDRGAYERPIGTSKSTAQAILSEESVADSDGTASSGTASGIKWIKVP